MRQSVKLHDKGKTKVAKRLASWFLSRKLFRAQHNHRILVSTRGMQKKASENSGSVASEAGLETGGSRRSSCRHCLPNDKGLKGPDQEKIIFVIFFLKVGPP